MALLGFLVIGLLAGWLAGWILKGRGAGVAGNMMIGIVGALIGGLVFRFAKVPVWGPIGSLLTATVGAVILLYLVDLFKK